MDKTEKRTAEEILDKHIAIRLEAIPDIVPAMHEYAAQELTDYKARLKKRITDWNSTSIEEVPPSYSWKDIFELIDKL